MYTPTILKFSHYLPTCLWRWNRQCVPKRRHIKFRSRGITQKKTYISPIYSCPKTLNNGYRVFPGGKERPGRDADPSPRSSAEGHERVELYLYSPYEPYGLFSASVPVQGWPLPLFKTLTCFRYSGKFVGGSEATSSSLTVPRRLVRSATTHSEMKGQDRNVTSLLPDDALMNLQQAL